MAELVFSISLLLVFFAFFGYPVSLLVINIFVHNNIRKIPLRPFITIIIPAHNEEKCIKNKLHNTLMLDYPKDKLEILVVSDGSTDRTDEIVRQYSASNVILLQIPERSGKSNAEIRAVEKSRGDILVFTDADTILDPWSVSEMINNYADPRVGCVSGTDSMMNKRYPSYGEEYYIKYEMTLRNLESNVSSIVGASGQFYSIRRSVGADYCKDLTSDGDFKAPLNAVRNGFLAIADPLAVCHYADDPSLTTEYARRVRTIIRGISSLSCNLEFMNFFRYGLFSYQLFCHKLLRWLVPFFLCTALLATADLAFHSVTYLFLSLAQVIFMFVGISGIIYSRLRLLPPVKIASYFMKVNLTTIAAWFMYIRGERMRKWSTERR